MNRTRTQLSTSIWILLSLSVFSAPGCGDDGGVDSTDGGAGGSSTQTTSAGGGGLGGGGDGGGGEGGTTAPTYGVEVDVSGLDGALVLAVAASGTSLTISGDGKHTIEADLEDGEAFEVELVSAPGLQTCTALVTTGVIEGADATGIAFTCTDHLAFVANDSSPVDFELWATDGTPEGTRLIKNISSLTSSIPITLVDAPGSRVFFSADDGENGRELWISDGTDTGTHMVRDILPGPEGNTINEMLLHQGKVYFAAAEGVAGEELWVSDGTEAGTQRLSNINPNGGSAPGYFTTLGARLLFVAADDVSQRLYALEADGATITDLGLADNDPMMVGGDGRLYFTSAAPGFGGELFVTDGTPQGTSRLSDVAAGPANSYPRVLAGLPGAFLFSAQEPMLGAELYVTDGTTVSLLGDLRPGSASSFPARVGMINDKALLRVDDGVVGAELWVSDGTIAGTQLLSDGTIGGETYFSMYAADAGQALLAAYSSIDGTRALWQTDGTVSGTTVLKAFPSGTSPAHYLGKVLGKHCFALVTPEAGAEPWCTDGTEAGTAMLLDLCPGTCSSIPVAG